MKVVDNKYLDWFIENSMDEDLGSGDATTDACIPIENRSIGYLKVKDQGNISGVELAEKIFKKYDPSAQFEKYIDDGEEVHFGDIVFKINCQTRSLLKTERLVLNSMQRMSGITTISKRFSFEVEDLHTKILDTRKTTPMIRPLEKWAVRLGGCYNYRSGLYDWIMIKDNHITAAGGIEKAINMVSEYQEKNKLDLGITIEIKNLVELHEVMEVGGVTRIMFDNFELSLMKEGVETVNKVFETEASGGVKLTNVRKIALTGVDYISVGALTHSAGILDMNLKIAQ